jgi:hypothetical protein
LFAITIAYVTVIAAVYRRLCHDNARTIGVIYAESNLNAEP